jgi:phage terminase large subunit-like protein
MERLTYPQDAYVKVCWCVLQRCSWCAVMARGFIATTGVTAGLTALTITPTNSTVSDICLMASGQLHA